MFTRELGAEIKRIGVATVVADDLLKQYGKIAQRLDASLGRFKLTAFGKPADGGSTRKSPQANPWSMIK